MSFQPNMKSWQKDVIYLKISYSGSEFLKAKKRRWQERGPVGANF